MSGLRFVYLLALVSWIGGLIVLGGIAAPAAFDVLQSRVPSEGRVLAGAVFGTALGRFHRVAYGCGGSMVATLILMALVGPRPRPFAPRLVVIALMLTATVIVAVPLGRRIEAAQVATGGPVAALAPADERRIEFERLHRLSSALLAGTVGGGLLLLLWEARERHT